MPFDLAKGEGEIALKRQSAQIIVCVCAFVAALPANALDWNAIKQSVENALQQPSSEQQASESQSQSAASTSVQESAPTSDLNPQGLSSAEILKIQELLVHYGYDPGRPDGIMGQGTSNAIKAYEKDVGMFVSGGAANYALLSRLKMGDEFNKKAIEANNARGATSVTDASQPKSGTGKIEIYTAPIAAQKADGLEAFGIPLGVPFNENLVARVKSVKKDDKRFTAEYDVLPKKANKAFSEYTVFTKFGNVSGVTAAAMTTKAFDVCERDFLAIYRALESKYGSPYASNYREIPESQKVASMGPRWKLANSDRISFNMVANRTRRSCNYRLGYSDYEASKDRPELAKQLRKQQMQKATSAAPPADASGL